MKISTRVLRENTGWRLRMARVAADFKTAVKLAEQLKIDQNSYSPYERGASFPPPEVLGEIIKLTGVTAEWLLYGDARHLTVSAMDKLKEADAELQRRIKSESILRLRPTDPFESALN